MFLIEGIKSQLIEEDEMQGHFLRLPCVFPETYTDHVLLRSIHMPKYSKYKMLNIIRMLTTQGSKQKQERDGYCSRNLLSCCMVV